MIYLPACSCGMPWVTEDGHVTYTAEWHRQHLDHHLDVYPNSDKQTVDTLQMRLDLAIQREETA